MADMSTPKQSPEYEGVSGSDSDLSKTPACLDTSLSPFE